MPEPTLDGTEIVSVPISSCSLIPSSNTALVNTNEADDLFPAFTAVGKLIIWLIATDVVVGATACILVCA